MKDVAIRVSTIERAWLTIYKDGQHTIPLTKQDILDLHEAASTALASWPERCAQCDEVATGTTYDHTSEDTIPGCEVHADPIGEAARCWLHDWDCQMRTPMCDTDERPAFGSEDAA